MCKLNIGCGKMYSQDYINVDISKAVQADEYWDATQGIPKDNDSVDEILCGCMLEQIDTNKDFIFFLNECHRVLKSGRVMKGYVPSTDPRVLCLDPMDRRFFQRESFNYMVRGHNLYENFGRTYGFTGWHGCETSINDNGILHFTLI